MRNNIKRNGIYRIISKMCFELRIRLNDFKIYMHLSHRFTAYSAKKSLKQYNLVVHKFFIAENE
eukprot:snap_masked-scaffold_11-processed-gene-3.35-mRNA-1 protein AED:1.00 eAED:1.00 QI:0/-1/0/0/-1/1/1/0/63